MKIDRRRQSRGSRRSAAVAARRLVAFLSLASVVGLAGSGPAAATCAAPPDLAEAIEAASSVFIGEATAAGFDSEEATLSVQWIWKGPDLDAELTVSTPLSDDSGEAGFRFREGSTYIVVVPELSSRLVVGECSGTRTYRSGGEDIPAELQEAAGRIAGRVPGELGEQEEADPRSGERTRAVWIGALAAIGMILVAIMAYQSRGREEEPGKKRVRGALSRGRSGDRQLGRLRRRRRRR